jgi:hypothetical protein
MTTLAATAPTTAPLADPVLDRTRAAAGHTAPPPPLRRLPVPATEPRPALRVVRDEPDEGVPGQGVLVFERAHDPRDLSATRATHVEDDPDAAFAARRPTSAGDLPDPARGVAQFVQVAVEVAAGFRPAGQLVRWTSEEVFQRLQRRNRLAGRPEVRTRARAGHTQVRGVRVCLPRDGVVEASAVVWGRDRVRAVALRLEGWDGRWRVTALEL